MATGVKDLVKPTEEMVVNSRAVSAEWDSIDLLAWQCRDEDYTNRRNAHRRSSREIARNHTDHRDSNFQHHLAGLTNESVGSLLKKLAVSFGLSWIDLSQLIGVSIPALRKWRLGGDITDGNLDKLRTLTAFFLTLQDMRVPDPSNWIHSRLVPEFSTVTPLHLYSSANIPELLGFVNANSNPVLLLHKLCPDWRQLYPSEFEVVEIEPGLRALVKK